jgi:hypothetical protein
MLYHEGLEQLLELRSTSALVDETASPFSSRMTELGRTLQLSNVHHATRDLTR